MEICELHVNIDKKLDRILELQLTQVEQVARLEETVNNGLKSAVVDIHGDVKKISDRVDVLETFKWFSEWVQKARDNVFFTFIKIGFGAVIIMLAYHFGNEALIKLLRG
jgi:hypothetical protein